MKAVVAAFNQEKALVGAFSVIANLRMELFEALVDTFLQCPPLLDVTQGRGSDTTESKTVAKVVKCPGLNRNCQKVYFVELGNRCLFL